MSQWRRGAWEIASGTTSTTITSSSAMSPSYNSTSLALALLLISAIPPCKGAAVFRDPSTTQNNELLNQIDTACSPLRSEERPLGALDSLWDLCHLMQGVLEKSQDLEARETTKRSTVFHPLLQLIPRLHSRRRRRVTSHETPRMIQSRGYFLYRPRNGRRSTEFV